MDHSWYDLELLSGGLFGMRYSPTAPCLEIHYVLNLFSDSTTHLLPAISFLPANLVSTDLSVLPMPQSLV